MTLKPIFRTGLFCFALLSGCVSADQVFNVDAPEKVEGEASSLSKDVRLVRSNILNRSFLYVHSNKGRIWKSPQLADYFCLRESEKRIDLDGKDGKDFLLPSGECNNACANRGIFVSLNGGKQNFVVHFKAKHDYGSFGKKPLIETSEKLSQAMMKRLAGHISCDDTAKKLIDKNDYHVMTRPDSKEAYTEIDQAHKTAMKQYRAGKKDAAFGSLNDVFLKYDYRSVDTANGISSYTGILNDYGFFLLKMGGNLEKDLAISVLEYVLQRDGGRMVAYLNLADAYWEATDEDSAKEKYGRYFEMMSKKGLQKKIPKRVMKRK